MEKYLPTNDLLFNKLLTSEDSPHILKAFVKDLLGLEFMTLKPKVPYHIDTYKKNYDELTLRMTEVDILATADDGSCITIECQIQKHKYFNERTLFYLAEAYCSPFGNTKTVEFIENNNFSALRPVYGIKVVDFDLFDREKAALRIFRLLDEQTHEPFIGQENRQLLMLCFLSLTNKNIKETSAACHWQHFLKTGEVTPDAPNYLKEAKRKIDFYSLKEDEQTMIMNINKTEAIRNAELSTARDEGIEQGLRKEKCTIARKMLAANLSFEQIAEFTGLKIDEIKKLRDEQK